jgi:hypothetical protein
MMLQHFTVKRNHTTSNYFFIPALLYSLAKNIFMKLKIILLACIFAGTTYTSYSQTQTSYSGTSDEEADAIVNLLGVQKKQAIAELVYVSPKDSAAFWKIYNEYQQQNNKVAKERLQLYEQTAHAYSNMTPAVADSLANKYFENRFNQEKSLKEYYNKIKAATNSVVAFQFYQAEVYLLTILRAQIMQQIPTYGQLMNASKK